MVTSNLNSGKLYPMDAKGKALKTILPFKNRMEFPALTDILLRKYCHHLIIDFDYSNYVIYPYLQSFLDYFNQIQCAKLIVLNLDITDITDVLSLLARTDISFLIALPDTKALFNAPCLLAQFSELCEHPNCRLLIFNNLNLPHPRFHEWFYHFKPQSLSYAEIIGILKYHLDELRDYHRVRIPDDVLSPAYDLANRFLPNEEIVRKTLLLIDSAAAKCACQTQENEAILNTATLANVVSRITEIPVNKLQKNNFHSNEFICAIKQDVIGQDEAINQIATQLQRTFSGFRMHSNRPLVSLLLAGCKFSGKKTMARALAKYLFGDINLIAIAHKHSYVATSLLDITFSDGVENKPITLKQLIYQKPYRIILLDDVDFLSMNAHKDLQQILMRGFLNSHDMQYDFRQAIVILTTQQGAIEISKTSQPLAENQKSDEPLEIIQSNMNSNAFAMQELGRPQIETELSINLIFSQYAAIIPFAPLHKGAVEKILTKQLDALIKQFAIKYQIELKYAAEIIRYLTDIALQNRHPDTGEIDLDHSFKSVYEVLDVMLLKPKLPNKIFLQLNETGHRLRCA